ncbi:EamA family transporter [Rurimicrobium arvi]|uniref:Drug/metabolite exporter YedA n=1 Tax=Rurimicrobium arvi TaxID=2049916 RepID=A0ABP8MIC8_9BACT
MNNHTRAYLSYAAICLIWGTTYLAIRVAVLHYPPFLMAGCRQVIAGVLTMVIALAVNRQRDLSWSNILQQALIGFLLITAGNGLVTWSEQYIQSGVAALICSTMPISSVLINIIRGKEKLNKWIVAGMLLGFSGVALIFKDNLSAAGSGHPLYGWAIAGLFAATVAWAYGSLLNKSERPKVNSFFDAGLQVTLGGALMLFISPFADDYSGIVWWNPEGFAAFAYLVVFGSLVAYSAYIYALKHLPVGFVMSYAYINPLVAVLLGAAVLNEPLNLFTVFAMALIITGIVVIRNGYRKRS